VDRTESRGRACVDMDTSRGSTEKALDELRACISGCAEDSIGRGGRAVFRSLCSRLFTKHMTGYKRKRVVFGLANLTILPRSRQPIINWRLVRHSQIEHTLWSVLSVFRHCAGVCEIQWHREMGHLRFLNQGQFSLKAYVREIISAERRQLSSFTSTRKQSLERGQSGRKEGL